MWIFLGASGGFAPEFRLDEESIVEICFLLANLKHLFYALLDAGPLDGLILVIEVLVHLLSVPEDLLVDPIVSGLGQQLRVLDILQDGSGFLRGEAEGCILEDRHSAGEECVAGGGKGVDE